MGFRRVIVLLLLLPWVGGQLHGEDWQYEAAACFLMSVAETMESYVELRMQDYGLFRVKSGILDDGSGSFAAVQTVATEWDGHQTVWRLDFNTADPLQDVPYLARFGHDAEAVEWEPFLRSEGLKHGRYSASVKPYSCQLVVRDGNQVIWVSNEPTSFLNCSLQVMSRSLVLLTTDDRIAWQSSWNYDDRRRGMLRLDSDGSLTLYRTLEIPRPLFPWLRELYGWYRRGETWYQLECMWTSSPAGCLRVGQFWKRLQRKLRV